MNMLTVPMVIVGLDFTTFVLGSKDERKGEVVAVAGGLVLDEQLLLAAEDCADCCHGGARVFT